MKVCTDACLFGAWVADLIYTNTLPLPNKVMDIGSGTGLLSLMLAQKVKAPIDAIEIDTQAYLQATENIKASIFKNNINTFHGPIELFAANTLYDFIICNPPFYENQLKSSTTQKNVAMHNDALTLPQLAEAISNNLCTNGKAAILLPYNRMVEAEKIFSNQFLFIAYQVNVQHRQSKNYFRTMFILSKKAVQKYSTTTIIIKDDSNNYTPQFAYLLKDYYLNL